MKLSNNVLLLKSPEL